MKSDGKSVRKILVMLAMLILSSFGIEAKINDDGLLDGIVNEFHTRSSIWMPVIKRYAIHLFWLLAGIEFSWTAIRLVFAKPDLTDVFIELTKRILFIGFFFTLLLYSNDWAEAIIQSFRDIGNRASVAAGGQGSISPSSIFDAGLRLSFKVLSYEQFLSFSHNAQLLIASIILIIIYALIAAILTIALVEMYLIINAGIILMAFGALTVTNDIAKQYFMYAISVGIKLFVIQLLVGIGESFIMSWDHDFAGEASGQITLLIGGSVVMLAIVHRVPDLLSNMITGGSFSQGPGISIGSAAMGLIAAKHLIKGGPFSMGPYGSSSVSNPGGQGSGGGSSFSSTKPWISPPKLTGVNSFSNSGPSIASNFHSSKKPTHSKSSSTHNSHKPFSISNNSKRNRR